jgi:hypothetical protein
MSGFHSHDDDFLYEFQRTDRTQDDVIEGQLVGFRTEEPNKKRKSSENKYTSPAGNTPPLAIEKLLTPAEVCEILRCSLRTLYNLSHWYKKRPPVLYPIMIRSRMRFRPSALESYIRRMEVR